MPLFTDGSTLFEDSVMNQVVIGDGVTGGATRSVMLICQTIYYQAGWNIYSERGLTQESNITLNWDGVNYKLDIDISGMDNTFSQKPAVAAVAFDNNVNPRQHTPVARCTDADTISVKFYDDDSASGPIVTAEDTKMCFTLWMFGKAL